MRLAFGLAALAISIGTHASAEDTLRLFTAEDVFELEWADEPQISPNGRQAIYTRRSNDVMTDRTRSHVWLVNLDGSSHEPLLADDASSFRSPRWSPDGRRIAYLKGNDDRTGLYVHYLESGRNAFIGDFEENIDHLTWSPDGEILAFTMAVKAEAESLVDKPKMPEGAEWADPAKVIDRARYRTNSEGFLELAYTHIFAIPADGGTERRLTAGDFQHNGPLSFTPDGQEIFFSANRNEEWELQTRESDIFSINVNSSELTQLTDASGVEASPRVSPNGRRIAYLRTNLEPQPFIATAVFVMDRDGGNARNLTENLDRRAGNLQWISGSEIAFTYQNRGENMIGVVDVNGKRRVAVEGIGGTTIGRPYVSGAYHANNGALVYTKGSAYRPADIYSTKNGRTRSLTSLNEDLLAHRNLGKLRSFTYESSLDGLEVQGWMITPPGYEEGKVYPMIIEIHGGPHLAYGPHFSAELQRMAAAGYIVIYDNHRGSIGYGSEFANLLKFKYSSPDDFADHMSAVDWAIDNGFADENNLFIAGGSAGGIATAYAIGLTDRFNAAVAAKPVINWVSKVLTADSYIDQIANQFPGPPWEELEHYWERSPLSLVGNVETPTMLITGELDYRTPISETEQFYQALQLRRVPSVMVRIPGTNHGIAGRPSRLNAKTDYTLAWFEKYRATN
ncbi:MAG: S9 family peptidase [Marinicaulis sp.]|nr:S9 family peptidase [Marinicaulis sp.]